MKPENIRYMARVNAAYYLIRHARKIAMRLDDTTSGQQQTIDEQEIEEEIVKIGQKIYEELLRETEPEVTHDPGEDHEREAYVAAVWELEPEAKRWFVLNDYYHGFSVEQSAERWRDHVNYWKGQAQQ